MAQAGERLAAPPAIERLEILGAKLEIGRKWPVP
jgi:hypothetical protein